MGVDPVGGPCEEKGGLRGDREGDARCWVFDDTGLLLYIGLVPYLTSISLLSEFECCVEELEELLMD